MCISFNFCARPLIPQRPLSFVFLSISPSRPCGARVIVFVRSFFSCTDPLHSRNRLQRVQSTPLFGRVPGTGGGHRRPDPWWHRLHDSHRRDETDPLPIERCPARVERSGLHCSRRGFRLRSRASTPNVHKLLEASFLMKSRKRLSVAPPSQGLQGGGAGCKKEGGLNTTFGAIKVLKEPHTCYKECEHTGMQQ